VILVVLIKKNDAVSKSQIPQIIEGLRDFYDIIPAQTPEKVKAAIETAKKAGFEIPPDLEAYFITCDGFKKKRK